MPTYRSEPLGNNPCLFYAPSCRVALRGTRASDTDPSGPAGHRPPPQIPHPTNPPHFLSSGPAGQTGNRYGLERPCGAPALQAPQEITTIFIQGHTHGPTILTTPLATHLFLKNRPPAAATTLYPFYFPKVSGREEFSRRAFALSENSSSERHAKDHRKPKNNFRISAESMVVLWAAQRRQVNSIGKNGRR